MMSNTIVVISKRRSIRFDERKGWLMGTANGVRILVADDEEGIRESLNLILGDHYDVAFATNGEEALAKLSSERFDLVLLDLKMPRLDGIELMKRMKRQQIDVPVLVLTAYQSVELAKEAVKLGAVDYLPKPFDREQILKTVRDALGQR